MTTLPSEEILAAVEQDAAAAVPEVSESAAPSLFDLVPVPLRRAMELRGFTELTPVQTSALEADAAGRDLRISSQTGSGKTVALGLAMAPDLMAPAADRAAGRRAAARPQALVIAPTRELAVQVHRELEWLFAGVRGVTVDSVTGGTSVPVERQRLGRGPRILVGTPGRLLDHMRNKALDCSAVGHLVLDEADQMLDMGFRDELDAILSAMPDERRTHLVSATFPEEVRALTERYQADPLRIEGSRLGAAHEDIGHVAHLIYPRDRYGALVNLLLLAEGNRTLVFVRTRADTAAVAEKLATDGFSALPLSGDLPQAQRTRTLSAFRAGTVSVLVATDVAARGLDIPEVSTVIHGDPPIDSAMYTHRSGRTGRAGLKGQSVLLVGLNAERRIRRLLAEAGVEATWQDIPDAARVRKVLQKRKRRRVRQAVERNLTPTEAQLTEAKRLLEEYDAADVVASLLAYAEPELPREPVDIGAATSKSAGWGPRAPHQPRSAGGAAPRRGDYVRFAINWGVRDGANPRRVLAHVCRRGGISSRLVGAIDMDAHSTTFDVAHEVAGAFAAKARRPDRRDPHLRIHEVGGDARRHAVGS